MDIKSVWSGIKVMPNKRDLMKYWTVEFVRGWWAQYWTPIWHEGRGPYISLGLGILAVYRGY